jgi:peptide/nickel transport system permease protein
MTGYVIRRLGWVIVVMLAVTLLTYGVFFVLPSSDPAVSFAGKQPTPELVAEVREQLELDQSVPQQYALYVKRLFLGDEYGWPGLGQSYNTRSPVLDEVTARAPVTLSLIVGASVVWLLIGIPLGVLAAVRRGTWVDRVVMAFALFGVCAPVFWLGLMALYLFSSQMGVLPGTGYVPFAESPADWLAHLILPWFVLALLFAGVYARIVRGSVIDTLGEDYVRTARAKGLRQRRVIGAHALRPSMVPVVTLLGTDLAVLVGGTIVMETVFNLPGLGSYALASTVDGDLPAVLAVVVLGSFAVAILGLLIDIAYAVIDPRVRLG